MAVPFAILYWQLTALTQNEFPNLEVQVVENQSWVNPWAFDEELIEDDARTQHTKIIDKFKYYNL